MQLKKDLTIEFLDDAAGIIDNEGFGYMLLDGGLGKCAPEFMLDADEDIKEVKKAIALVKEYYSIMPSY